MMRSVTQLCASVVRLKIKERRLMGALFDFLLRVINIAQVFLTLRGDNNVAMRNEKTKQQNSTEICRSPRESAALCNIGGLDGGILYTYIYRVSGNYTYLQGTFAIARNIFVSFQLQ